VPLDKKISQVAEYDRNISLSTFELGKLIPFDISDYFRYSGSLTTPKCKINDLFSRNTIWNFLVIDLWKGDEIVDWFVVDYPILNISENELLDFQTVEDDNHYPVSVFTVNT
jgi:carbonic anhydrase